MRERAIRIADNADHGVDIRALLNAYLTALDGLRPYGIESICDFAEYAFEKALNGKRERRGSKGHDW